MTKKQTKQPVNTQAPQFSIINFNSAYEPPSYAWDKGKGLIKWGTGNDYPDFLLKVFNYEGSTRHTSIINKKVSLGAGQGFEEVADQRLKDFITENNLTESLTRAFIDYEIFNGFALEVIWAADEKSIASIKHIPIAQLRFGIMDDDHWLPYFWYCKDWKKSKIFLPEPIVRYNPDFPVGKQIYYFSTYNPGNVMIEYPIPYYSTCLNSIETDYEISRFHLSQAKNGYAPSFVLNFATGIPSNEEMDAFYRKFESKYAGTKNAGKAIITYSEGKDQAPSLDVINLNDSDERFLMLQDRIENDIVQGSGIPPQLVILTPGKLGSTEDRSALMKEFQQSYISPRQNTMENVLDIILKNNNYSSKLIIKKYAE